MKSEEEIKFELKGLIHEREFIDRKYAESAYVAYTLGIDLLKWVLEE